MRTPSSSAQAWGWILKAHLRAGRTRQDPNDPTAYRDDPTPEARRWHKAERTSTLMLRLIVRLGAASSEHVPVTASRCSCCFVVARELLRISTTPPLTGPSGAAAGARGPPAEREAEPPVRGGRGAHRAGVADPIEDSGVRL